MAECGCKLKVERHDEDTFALVPLRVSLLDSTACQYAEVLRQRNRFVRAIAELQPVEYYGLYDSQRCFFCAHNFDEDYQRRPVTDPEQHAPGCDWIAAREALSTPQQEVKKA